MPREGYPRWLIEALVFGEFSDPLTGKTVDAEDWEWNHLRARIERTGNVESVGMALVMDLERALLALFSHHPEAAVAVQAMMMFQPDTPNELQPMFGHRLSRWWVEKSIAFMSAYLSGAPVSGPKGTYSCESAWRSAR